MAARATCLHTRAANFPVDSADEHLSAVCVFLKLLIKLTLEKKSLSVQFAVQCIF